MGLRRRLPDDVREPAADRHLAANAVKFTGAGSVVLGVSPVPGGLRMEVTDTGIGIAAEQQELLFRPFSQVDVMGGRVGVESQLGTGSTFWFDIPCGHVLALPVPGR